MNSAEPKLISSASEQPEQQTQTVTILESAIKYSELGFCIIPVHHRSKQAAVKWEDYYQLKKPKPTIDQIKSWLTDSDNNFAVIHGKVSGSIEFDIDGNGGKKHFEQIFPKLSPNLQSAIKNTMRVISSNGQKIIFKYRPEEWPEGINTIKDLWKGEGKHNGIELLGNGSYSLRVGSVHPDG
jgi:Bifunctional DNA primase/polymerase, N-terminal